MKLNTRFVLALVLALALAPFARGEARPLVHPLFCDHVVLQRDVAVPVWGWTEPGAGIAVAFGGQTRRAVADADGKWVVRLDPMPASTEPRVLRITPEGGGQGYHPEPLVISDVLVGDVWLCSGQSNMEMGVGVCRDASNEIASATYPLLRLLTVPHLIATEPESTLSCRWAPCAPDTVRAGGWGGFSGAAYFFGRQLQQELQIPIGLIHSSWGGTVAEAWTSLEQLKTLPDFKERLEHIAADRSAKPQDPNISTVLYNGMIAPLLPFAIRGAIWYQGESNAGRAAQYRALLPAMIRDWRGRFGVGDFPFYIVQLAAWQPAYAEPRESDWAELREAQALTAKTLPHSGLAVAIDIGEASDIHPKNKQEVGRRLALCALANTYGKPVEWSGPWYKGMERTDQGIRLSFDHLGGGLVAKGDHPTRFAIAGEDRKFVWAEAVIQGDQVLVSSPQVAKPVAVRYGWDINPVCNLYNQAGLPAVPFRTDDWPGVTDGRK